MLIAFLGGTGRLGRALLKRCSQAGFTTVVGTRDVAAAGKLIAEMQQQSPMLPSIEIMDYAAAVEKAAIVFITIPFPESRAVACALAPLLSGKILIDASVPMLLNQGLASCSAVATTQTLLGAQVHVVSAFQTIAAALLHQDNLKITANVLITGNNMNACQQVMEVVHAMGLQGIYCGSIEHSLTSENLAITLMGINRHYQSSCAGVEISL